jgi:hypothetical protein
VACDGCGTNSPQTCKEAQQGFNDIQRTSDALGLNHARTRVLILKPCDVRYVPQGLAGHVAEGHTRCNPSQDRELPAEIDTLHPVCLRVDVRLRSSLCPLWHGIGHSPPLSAVTFPNRQVNAFDGVGRRRRRPRRADATPAPARLRLAGSVSRNTGTNHVVVVCPDGALVAYSGQSCVDTHTCRRPAPGASVQLGGIVNQTAASTRYEHQGRLDPAWLTRGTCRHHPHLDWIEPSPVDVDECRSICGRCPVQAECLESALKSQEPWGIWGGLDPGERQKLARVRDVPSPRVLPAHGTNPRYAKHGCRCDPCRSAHAEYERRRRHRRRLSSGTRQTRPT